VKVAVHLTATLRGYLPPGTRGDNVVLDVPDGTTVDQVIHSLRSPSQLERLTVVNGRDAAQGQRLVEGDVLSVFPPLAGGR
jgi:molybdopterin converting factor small subunit